MPYLVFMGILTLLYLTKLSPYLTRCEALMRSAERELLEMERKRQAGDGPGGANANKIRSAGDQVKERLSELTKQIAEESKRLATTRSQLQKLKSSASTVVLGTGTGVTVNATGATTSAGIMKAFLAAGSGKAQTEGGSTTAEKPAAPSGKGKKAAAAAGGDGATVEKEKHHTGAVASVVPDSCIPELCK
jgi:hypothetical protein